MTINIKEQWDVYDKDVARWSLHRRRLKNVAASSSTVHVFLGELDSGTSILTETNHINVMSCFIWACYVHTLCLSYTRIGWKVNDSLIFLTWLYSQGYNIYLGNLLSIVIHSCRKGQHAINRLLILWLKVVIFLIFNEGTFKRERDGAIRLATLYEAMALGRGRWPLPTGKASDTHFIGGWMNPRNSLDTKECRKISTLPTPRIEPGSSSS